ncbi:TPA: pyruvate kinase [Candidatus Uhrbacteria bacterium]|nr:MAG: Pyruvate kinase [Parcubacteria group bacterium GW2011_GWA2_53_21]OGL71065.1 MAG: pyruvate kinase [Candidatus Uhrbacteria bacterium RIFCSPHIGHO2_02_FULL_54_11]HBL39102.1 pyruvate kinase [Candidatus Uhrbacteria bacterium]
MKRRTKIIATVGPTSQSVATLERMMRAGMNAARLNFSHGTHASHRGLIRSIRKASRDAKRHVAILADLQGPKIRVGALPSSVNVKRGMKIVLPVTFAGLGAHLKKGARVLLDDGRVEAEYLAGRGETVTVRIVSGGEISSHVGLAVPGLKLKGVSVLTSKDKDDAFFAMKEHADWLVQSFVTKPADIAALRRFVHTHADSGFEPKIMAKIERAEAVKNARAIIKAADGVMIGRGDLGLDLPLEEVPLAQKKIIRLCREAGKPVVVATHMLESMITNPRPTRAEVSDVANAVIDHTDGVLLAGETAKGAYPLEAVEMMSRVIVETEASAYDDLTPEKRGGHLSKVQSFAFLISELAYAGRIKHLAVSIHDTTLLEALSLYRPEVSVFVLGTNPYALRQELVRWGAEPVKILASLEGSDPERLAQFLLKERQVKKGSAVTVVHARRKEPTFTTVKV